MKTESKICDNCDYFDWCCKCEHLRKLQAQQKEDDRAKLCVNACTGIGTQALEDGVVGEMLKALKLASQFPGENIQTGAEIIKVIAKAETN